MLKIIDNMLFQIGFGEPIRLGDFQKFQHIGLAKQIGWFFYYFTLLSQLQNGFFILRSSQTKKKGRFLLAF